MDASPDSYDKIYPEYLSKYVVSILDRFIPIMKWTDDDIILDIGCGPGKTTKHILLPRCSKLKKLVAIDVIPSLINYARENYYDDKIEFKMQNIIESIETEDIEKYSKIFSFYALNFICDFDKLFSAISTILKQGGYFCFIIVATSPVYFQRRILSNCEEWQKYIKRENMLATIPPTADWNNIEEEFIKLISKFDLNVMESKYEVLDVPCTNKKEFGNLMKMVTPKIVFQNMPDEIEKKLWHESENLLFEYGAREENGKILFSTGMLTVYGQKISYKESY